MTKKLSRVKNETNKTTKRKQQKKTGGRRKKQLTPEEEAIYAEAYALANKLNGRLSAFGKINAWYTADYDKIIRTAKEIGYLQKNGKFVRKSYKSMDLVTVKNRIIPALRLSLEDREGNQLLTANKEELKKKQDKLLKDFGGAFRDVSYREVNNFLTAKQLRLWRQLIDQQVDSETQFEIVTNANKSNFNYNGKTGVEAFLDDYFDKTPPERRDFSDFTYNYFMRHPAIKHNYTTYSIDKERWGVK